MFALGRNPSPPGGIQLQLPDFANLTALPTPPLVFGHNLGLEWGALGNLDRGDCTIAGAAHEVMLWTREWAAKAAPFDADTVVKQYLSLTGGFDTGLSMATVAAWRRKTGIADTLGVVHKVDAYLGMNAHNLDDLLQAAYLFGAVGLGVYVPKSAGDQFYAQQPWTVVRGSKMLGGHYVPLIGRNSHGHFLVVTWGRLQAVEPAWISKYTDEAVAYISLEHIGAQGFTKEGFNADRLRQALSQLGGVANA